MSAGAGVLRLLLLDLQERRCHGSKWLQLSSPEDPCRCADVFQQGSTPAPSSVAWGHNVLPKNVSSALCSVPFYLSPVPCRQTGRKSIFSPKLCFLRSHSLFATHFKTPRVYTLTVLKPFYWESLWQPTRYGSDYRNHFSAPPASLEILSFLDFFDQLFPDFSLFSG